MAEQSFVTRMARIGAEQRLRELNQERVDILDAFPDLRPQDIGMRAGSEAAHDVIRGRGTLVPSTTKRYATPKKTARRQTRGASGNRNRVSPFSQSLQGILSQTGREMTTEEVMAVVKDRGVRVKGKYPMRVVATTLAALARSGNGVQRSGNGWASA